MLKRFLSSARPRREQPVAVPPGCRVYAIGDIHGCADLLDQLLATIAVDRDGRDATLVFLGDLIDRGPQSADVVERLLALSESENDVRFLLGNHEEMFLAALDGRLEAVRAFSRVGGRETILSYGMTVDDYERLDYAELYARFDALVPERHRAFLESFEDTIVIGDYAFVHAGIRPGVPLDQQRGADLRWIREPFLDHAGRHEKVVVHGHTIRPTVEFRGNRIGIDTGAYASGRLTALVLEGEDRRLIQT